MFDTDKAREFFSWKITIIGILLVTIVAIICITLLAQFGNGKFVIAPRIFRQISVRPVPQSVTFDIVSRCFENKNNNC